MAPTSEFQHLDFHRLRSTDGNDLYVQHPSRLCIALPSKMRLSLPQSWTL